MKAFPVYFKHPTTGMIVDNEGMELRDFFAGLALQGYLANTDFTHYEPDEKATIAYQMADLMLNQRKEVPNE